MFPIKLHSCVRLNKSTNSEHTALSTDLLHTSSLVPLLLDILVKDKVWMRTFLNTVLYLGSYLLSFNLHGILFLLDLEYRGRNLGSEI